MKKTLLILLLTVFLTSTASAASLMNFFMYGRVETTYSELGTWWTNYNNFASGAGLDKVRFKVQTSLLDPPNIVIHLGYVKRGAGEGTLATVNSGWKTLCDDNGIIREEVKIDFYTD